MGDLAKNLCAAMQDDLVCLHPTDSIPGFTFHPNSQRAHARLEATKGRAGKLGYIGLVADLAFAQKFWEPLPTEWRTALSELWPAPISVAWRANDNCPRTLVAPDGTSCFRYPALEDQRWLYTVIKEIGLPLPTTSVNPSGSPAIVEWQEALAWLRDNPDVYSYDLSSKPTVRGMPSTIIRIIDNKTCEVLRAGAFELNNISRNFKVLGSWS
jgi:tRNA A37 threonylcarbamoyladenosine synthetase subunit TsaC/SUA5/YrdC